MTSNLVVVTELDVVTSNCSAYETGHALHCGQSRHLDAVASACARVCAQACAGGREGERHCVAGLDAAGADGLVQGEGDGGGAGVAVLRQVADHLFPGDLRAGAGELGPEAGQ